jgi:hypothetical protein
MVQTGQSQECDYLLGPKLARPAMDSLIPCMSVRQPRDHRNLHGAHDLPRSHAESREAEKALALSLNQRLHETACFRKRPRTQICSHRNFKQTIRYPLRIRFRLA